MNITSCTLIYLEGGEPGDYPRKFSTKIVTMPTVSFVLKSTANVVNLKNFLGELAQDPVASVYYGTPQSSPPPPPTKILFKTLL